MSRCNAYIINPKKCKKSPMKDNDYCRHHSKYNNSFVPVKRKCVSTQYTTDDLPNKRLYDLTLFLFLFYFFVYCFIVYFLVMVKLNVDFGTIPTKEFKNTMQSFFGTILV